MKLPLWAMLLGFLVGYAYGWSRSRDVGTALFYGVLGALAAPLALLLLSLAFWMLKLVLLVVLVLVILSLARRLLGD